MSVVSCTARISNNVRPRAAACAERTAAPASRSRRAGVEGAEGHEVVGVELVGPVVAAIRSNVLIKLSRGRVAVGAVLLKLALRLRGKGAVGKLVDGALGVCLPDLFGFASGRQGGVHKAIA